MKKVLLAFALAVSCAAPASEAPRLLFTEKTVGEVRARCAQGGDLARSARALVGSARRWVGQDLMPEPPFLTGLKGPARGKAYQDIFRAIRPPCAQMAECALAYLLTGDAARAPGAGAPPNVVACCESGSCGIWYTAMHEEHLFVHGGLRGRGGGGV